MTVSVANYCDAWRASRTLIAVLRAKGSQSAVGGGLLSMGARPAVETLCCLLRSWWRPAVDATTWIALLDMSNNFSDDFGQNAAGPENFSALAGCLSCWVEVKLCIAISLSIVQFHMLELVTVCIV